MLSPDGSGRSIRGGAVNEPDDHAQEVLKVYASRALDGGWWHPEHGDLEAPGDWEFLPPGDAYVTRTVKRLGSHWVVLKRGKGYTATVGILAPAANVREARRLAEETKARREGTRERSQQRRQKQERSYRERFAAAALRYLDFTLEYGKLAKEIAEGASERATEVGSGRVGRTAKLTLEEKAELAARAYIRHRHTVFEEHLMEEGLFDVDELAYREARPRLERK